MDLIDSHCHLLSFQKKNELGAVLSRASEAGVGHMIAVGTSIEDWVPYRELNAAHPHSISYSVGLHPCYVNEEWEDAVGQISAFFMPPSAPVALGEIGLDYFHLPKEPIAAGECLLLQEAAFREQLDLAAILNCPIIIHSRDAFDDTYRMIMESGVDWEKVVFHCFSYGSDEIKKINAAGGRASFTGIVTYKNAPAVREALRAQGVDRLMLETDCPYLSPEPHRGEPNEPAFMLSTAKYCGQILNLTTEALAAHCTANTKRFFAIH
ncbi:MAG: TatD family hydrolase [Verrucomicrobiota bacterium]|nr:TatD family hydrolase [Verrucomicrobiota bacterium]